jgi:hypothetical protein
MANVFNFDNYDPSSKYDPSSLFNGSSPTGNGNNLAQVSVKATNAYSSGANKVQLFNYLRSIDEIVDASLTTSVPGIFPNITLTEGTPNTIITATRTYFDQTGDLYIKESATDYIVVNGTTVPYKTLTKGSAIMPFQVKRLRYSYTSDSQLDEEIVIFKRTIFGKYTENRVSPRSYFDPNQMQSKVVDIPIEFSIDAETGIQINLLASEVVTLNFFCDVITRPSI